MSEAPLLALDGATVRAPGEPRPLLDGVTLAVRPGECVALVGPNGAGKTTAVRAVLGLVQLASGAARVDGTDATGWDRAALARLVGVVGQREEPAFPLTVDELVMMGRYAHLGPWRRPGVGDRAAVARALGRADVSHLAERWVETLSGGEWQRVRLARALAQEPRVLVLDEPTASLDLRHEMELFELLATLVERHGMAALVVSHHLNVAARFAHRLVLMAGGRVLADGPPREVLTPDLLREVYDWPVTVRSLTDGTPQLHPERRPMAGQGREP